MIDFSKSSNSIRWLNLKTISGGQTVPAEAVLQVIDTGTRDDGALVFNVDQVGSATNPGFNANVVFNGAVDLSTSNQGIGSGQLENPVEVMYDTGTPARGDVYGLKPGQYSLTKNGVGTFLVDGVTDATNKKMIGRWLGIQTLICTLAGTVSARSGTTPGSGSNATIQYFSSGALTATSWTTTLYNSSKSTISQYLADGSTVKYVQAKYINGFPFIDVDDCN